MYIKDVMAMLEERSPLAYAEDFDNTGLLVGSRDREVTGILITHDTLEEVVDEAIEKGCNLIVSFHPIIFSGLKKLNGSSYVERTVIKAIRHDIAIYAIHTALDNAFNGVNAAICDALELQNREILIPQKGTIKKLLTFVPRKNADHLREALFAAGAGTIGNYSHCSFNLEGTGTFHGEENSNPVIGEKGVTRFEPETQIGVTYPRHLEGSILKALFANHPYEEVAYEVTTLENNNQHIGIGMIGELAEAVPDMDFLRQLKQKMQLACIRHSGLLDRKIKKVAVLGGSGAFGISHAKKAGADIFITGDVKYHEFYKAEKQMIIADVGHYESEQYTKNLLFEHLTKKIHNFAPALPGGKVVLSEFNTNSIKYL
ncbi:Nif3-like dinuclear metal center hexameric protein [Sinomicrobium weinanense]|uniref:GTP cyclohydrolase 1 type 2 homolog n=1 Tax=Sinomicrobium weinanense TaxID=2842200 RepID=A0A926Q230_9FLAO|nr:Nif3-like dinuclear metal center hexameric protein [Sinomicrobium weinanense]MBC9796103.1 Nif3-like dinuclear metal center hexameric protein [Sinomicrobium weinanense]MBU3124772.1 Nif3-like dinuclear metal center hexameric protein [Sinomicrobium weinanense]